MVEAQEKYAANDRRHRANLLPDFQPADKSFSPPFSTPRQWWSGRRSSECIARGELLRQG
jgi:hypothetical protein